MLSSWMEDISDHETSSVLNVLNSEESDGEEIVLNQEVEPVKEPLLPKGSLVGAAGNLANTILGAGMLGLPLAIKSSGSLSDN